MELPPRIRGKVEINEDGKFYFELSIWDFYGKAMVGDPFIIGPWESEAIAQSELKKCAQLSCEAIEKSYGFEPSKEYMDMKNGAMLRPWVEQ